MTHQIQQSEPAISFAEQASQKQSSIVREFWDFIRYYKVWWLTPIILAILLVGTLVVLGGTAAAPFIYALF